MYKNKELINATYLQYNYNTQTEYISVSKNVWNMTPMSRTGYYIWKGHVDPGEALIGWKSRKSAGNYVNAKLVKVDHYFIINAAESYGN